MNENNVASLILIVAGYAILFWVLPAPIPATILGVHLLLAGINT